MNCMVAVNHRERRSPSLSAASLMTYRFTATSSPPFDSFGTPLAPGGNEARVIGPHRGQARRWSRYSSTAGRIGSSSLRGWGRLGHAAVIEERSHIPQFAVLTLEMSLGDEPERPLESFEAPCGPSAVSPGSVRGLYHEYKHIK
jgi:hypothetical protein